MKQNKAKDKAKVLFLDIDNTILFSGNHAKVDDDTCVEYKLGKEQGYMLEELADTIYDIEVVSHKDIYIVPLTTRSVEQYFRTRLADDCRYGITTCGGELFKLRKPNLKWLREQKEKMYGISNYLFDAFDFLNRNCGDEASFCRIVDGYYVFLRSTDKDKLKKLEVELRLGNEQEQIETEIDIINTGTKLTVIPSFLNKGSAVDKFIKEFKEMEGYEEVETWGFGDSVFDVPMLNKVDHVMCSKELLKNISKDKDIIGAYDGRFDREILKVLKTI